jgi:hypothetical protein
MPEDAENRFTSPDQANIGPVHLALGDPFLRDRSLPDGRKADQPCPAFEGLRKERPADAFFDIRAVNEFTIELYLTADGRLSVWTFDGSEWVFQRVLPPQIHGVFRICHNGTAAVAVRDEHWCLISPLDSETPEVIPLAPANDSDRLWIVEDTVKKETFFVNGNAMLTMEGKQITSVPDNQTHSTEQKVEWIAEFVRAK